MTGLRLIRYAPDGTPLAEIEWWGVGDYAFISGELDEDGRYDATSIPLPAFVNDYVNVMDAYNGEPYWGWPEEGLCA